MSNIKDSYQDVSARNLKNITLNASLSVLKRSVLNNVTNTNLLQDYQHNNTNANQSNINSFNSILKHGNSNFQSAKTAGSFNSHSKRNDTFSSIRENKENLVPSRFDTRSIKSLKTIRALSNIEEEEKLTLQSQNLKYEEHQSLLNDDNNSVTIEQRKPVMEMPISSLNSSVSGRNTNTSKESSQQALDNDLKKKRPISTVVEQDIPKKFKVCEKNYEYEWEDLDAEDINDPFMVCEYVNEIFEYLNKLEVMTLPKKNDLFKHANIQQNRDILVNWMVKIHNKFGLLPETLYLALNIMDRFLGKELVQLEKLQLVGTACLFIASKYEEVYSPSVKHFAYETDGACDEDEIKEGEKFILKTLEFNLNYPNPMNFLRRISKADDYDIQSRTLAKYLLEISAVDFKFIGILPSLCAAAAMFLSRKMLGKAKWDGNLIHYSGGYTIEELTPVCNMIMDYLVQSVVHDELFKKYASRRFMKASIISRQWAKKVMAHNYDIMTLHETG